MSRLEWEQSTGRLALRDHRGEGNSTTREPCNAEAEKSCEIDKEQLQTTPFWA
jgi:hypothetical protein